MKLFLLQVSQFVSLFLLLFGLKQMSQTQKARKGIQMAGWGMLILCVAVLLFSPYFAFQNAVYMAIAIALGSYVAIESSRRVQMVQMPQMIAIYNGMGGGAAAAIAAIEIFHTRGFLLFRLLGLVGAFVGAFSFSGSIVAFAKLQEWLKKTYFNQTKQIVNLLLIAAIVFVGFICLLVPSGGSLSLFYLLLILLGVAFTLPIGGANMPVVISFFNALTGIAVCFNGFVLNNPVLIIAGTVVGASGILLTRLMATAMNQSILAIFFSRGPSGGAASSEIQGFMKAIDLDDAAIMLNYAKQMIIVPGYGMAVSQAHFKLYELMQQLEERQVRVKFAIHPVAGRMPGHMNVLLAEAGIPYDRIYDLDEINSEFAQTDVALVIGANDIVNPDARQQPDSPIYGMPILDVTQAKQVLVIKRGQGKGFSNIENPLFTQDNVRMLFGPGQEKVNELLQAVKTL